MRDFSCSSIEIYRSSLVKFKTAELMYLMDNLTLNSRSIYEHQAVMSTINNSNLISK
jgi:hypothetical protein